MWKKFFAIDLPFEHEMQWYCLIHSALKLKVYVIFKSNFIFKKYLTRIKIKFIGELLVVDLEVQLSAVFYNPSYFIT